MLAREFLRHYFFQPLALFRVEDLVLPGSVRHAQLLGQAHGDLLLGGEIHLHEGFAEETGVLLLELQRFVKLVFRYPARSQHYFTEFLSCHKIRVEGRGFRVQGQE